MIFPPSDSAINGIPACLSLGAGVTAGRPFRPVRGKYLVKSALTSLHMPDLCTSNPMYKLQPTIPTPCHEIARLRTGHGDPRPAAGSSTTRRVIYGRASTIRAVLVSAKYPDHSMRFLPISRRSAASRSASPRAAWSTGPPGTAEGLARPPTLSVSPWTGSCQTGSARPLTLLRSEQRPREQRSGAKRTAARGHAERTQSRSGQQAVRGSSSCRGSSS